MIFQLGKDTSTGRHELKPVPLSRLSDAGWTEKDLENVLAGRIELILREDQLMVISQERKWQEEADILALDEKGALYIFEIKRWQSDDSNLLQVIRYGQIFGQFPYEKLEDLYRKYREDPSANLAEAHGRLFDFPDGKFLSTRDFNQDQQFVVVTAGIDIKTLDGIRYWRDKGLPISALTYHVYKRGDDFLLEFHSYSPQPDDYLGLLSNDYIVNTNVTYSKTAYSDMLAKGKAAAYEGRKGAVDHIQKGDRVFLYHTGVGVCAVGRATNNVQSCAFGGIEGEEHYVPLRLELQVDPVLDPNRCLSAREINLAMGTSHRFRLTVFGIEKAMADKIEDLFKQKLAPEGEA